MNKNNQEARGYSEGPGENLYTGQSQPGSSTELRVFFMRDFKEERKKKKPVGFKMQLFGLGMKPDIRQKAKAAHYTLRTPTGKHDSGSIVLWGRCSSAGAGKPVGAERARRTKPNTAQTYKKSCSSLRQNKSDFKNRTMKGKIPAKLQWRRSRPRT